PFFLLSGKPVETMIAFIDEHGVGELVTDFSPLRLHRRWKSDIAKRITIPFYEVDAHNVIPSWLASEKQEFAAFTFRPKVNRALPGFLDKFPKLKKQTVGWQQPHLTDWKNVRRTLDVDTTVQPVDWLTPGETAAHKVLQQFKLTKLEHYGSLRNDPTKSAQSDLSPYLHFGQISAQRVALEVSNHIHDVASREAFLEELIVRRELSDNFCLYNKSYDSVEGFSSWARASLDRHRGDPREFNYTRTQFEHSRTHDALWNAAQAEMVVTGKMHGFMRMYWAKKILEWTATPEDAMRIAIFLNDKYHLDGCDPNGYTGIAWSLGGVHDRAWGERKIFGKVRYMNYNGCKRKFDVKLYIENIQRMRGQ
ncbi:MAG: deoxyribodipyrimidine photo-lyase, partial [bacterium]